ncbi:MAG: DUF1292 domain-containing protein [Oscillospiraceae bacterium]|nr:DUF1292 domain-containing protein [Oscillospiraceae bacterium]
MSEAPDIILLTNDRGERVGFQPVATVPYNDSTYMILRPVTPMEGADEGDAFVFSLSQVDGDQAEDSGSWLSMETDDEIIDGVFALYEESLGQI